MSSCSGYEEEIIKEQEKSQDVSRSMNYDYPSVWEIVNDSDLYDDLWDIWYSMYRKQTSEYRMEAGCYIYYNFSTGKPYCGEVFYGPKVYYNEDYSTCASLTYGQVVNETKLCAFFHCHPPYRSYKSHRPVGPSDADIQAAYLLGVPGILMDYSGAGYVDAYFDYDHTLPGFINFGPERKASN